MRGARRRFREPPQGGFSIYASTIRSSPFASISPPPGSQAGRPREIPDRSGGGARGDAPWRVLRSADEILPSHGHTSHRTRDDRDGRGPGQPPPCCDPPRGLAPEWSYSSATAPQGPGFESGRPPCGGSGAGGPAVGDVVPHRSGAAVGPIDPDSRDVDLLRGKPRRSGSRPCGCAFPRRPPPLRRRRRGTGRSSPARFRPPGGRAPRRPEGTVTSKVAVSSPAVPPETRLPAGPAPEPPVAGADPEYFSPCVTSIDRSDCRRPERRLPGGTRTRCGRRSAHGGGDRTPSCRVDGGQLGKGCVLRRPPLRAARHRGGSTPSR